MVSYTLKQEKNEGWRMPEAVLLKSSIRLVAVTAAATLLLSACAGQSHSVVIQKRYDGTPVHATGVISQNYYTVVRGDTLYSIAFRTKVNYHELAKWNHINAPYIIHPGQRLRLSPPAKKVIATTPVVASTKSKPAKQKTTTTSKKSKSAAKSATVSSSPKSVTHSSGGIVWSWPAQGPVSTSFKKTDPIPGITIAGKKGDPVHAAGNGVVVYSGNGLVGYGELIIIKHSDNYLSAYGHNSKRLVKEGEKVKAGQLIAYMGSTGTSHNELEFQIRYKGSPVNPLKYLPTR